VLVRVAALVCLPPNKAVKKSMDEIVIPQTTGHVGLRIFRPERGSRGELDYFSVEVMSTSISATTRVYAYRCDDLATLFDEMSRDWRGWQGSRDWESLEGELKLSCTADGKGHIVVSIRIAESLNPDTWRIQTTAMIEAGQVDQIAKAVRRFLEGGRAA